MRRFAPAVLAASMLVAVVGCGGDGSVDLSSCEPLAPTDGVTELTVVGKNLAFDVECVEIEPGPLEITFVNEDSGVSHNIHVTGPGGVDEATDLERGKVTQELVLDLVEPGTYKFICDPHPSSMKGHIVVREPGEAGGAG